MVSREEMEIFRSHVDHRAEEDRDPLLDNNARNTGPRESGYKTEEDDADEYASAMPLYPIIPSPPSPTTYSTTTTTAAAPSGTGPNTEPDSTDNADNNNNRRELPGKRLSRSGGREQPTRRIIDSSGSHLDHHHHPGQPHHPPAAREGENRSSPPAHHQRSTSLPPPALPQVTYSSHNNVSFHNYSSLGPGREHPTSVFRRRKTDNNGDDDDDDDLQKQEEPLGPDHPSQQQPRAAPPDQPPPLPQPGLSLRVAWRTMLYAAVTSLLALGMTYILTHTTTTTHTNNTSSAAQTSTSAIPSSRPAAASSSSSSPPGLSSPPSLYAYFALNPPNPTPHAPFTPHHHLDDDDELTDLSTLFASWNVVHAWSALCTEHYVNDTSFFGLMDEYKGMVSEHYAAMEAGVQKLGRGHRELGGLRREVGRCRLVAERAGPLLLAGGRRKGDDDRDAAGAVRGGGGGGCGGGGGEGDDGVCRRREGRQQEQSPPQELFALLEIHTTTLRTSATSILDRVLSEQTRLCHAADSFARSLRKACRELGLVGKSLAPRASGGGRDGPQDRNLVALVEGAVASGQFVATKAWRWRREGCLPRVDGLRRAREMVGRRVEGDWVLGFRGTAEEKVVQWYLIALGEVESALGEVLRVANRR